MMRFAKVTMTVYCNEEDVERIVEELNDAFYGSDCGQYRADPPMADTLSEDDEMHEEVRVALTDEFNDE